MTSHFLWIHLQQQPLLHISLQAILIEDDFQYQQQQQPVRRLSFNGGSLGGSASSAFTPVTPSSPYLYNRNSTSSSITGVSSPTAFQPPLRSGGRARSFSTSCSSPGFATTARRRSSTGLLLSETLSPLNQHQYQQQQQQPLHHTPQPLLQQQQQQQRQHSPYAVSPAGGFNSSDRLPENQDMLCSNTTGNSSSNSNSAGSDYRYAQQQQQQQQQQQRLLDSSSVLQRTGSYTSSGPSSPW
jgi:hypothetical protein